MIKLLSLATLSFSSFVSAQTGIEAIAKAYTPNFGDCPENFQLLRSAGIGKSQTLSRDEVAYISSREEHVLPNAWSSYANNVLHNKDTYTQPLPNYVSGILKGTQGCASPRLGISTSGGGHRAAIFGAGVLNALDGRNSSSSDIGTGGLLQAASYIVGLSGGSWLVTSAVQANFPPINEVIFGSNASQGSSDWGGWITELDLTSPSSDQNIDLQFLEGIIAEISGKHDAGFPMTITDFWGRLLARHFVNGTSAESFFDDSDTTHGAGLLFSDIANVLSFKSYNVPFPIIVSNSKSNKQDQGTIAPDDPIPLTNVIYETSPYEMGSFDPMLSSFTPTKYLGTINTSVCVTNYDQASLLIGTSSDLFNGFNTSETDITQTSVGPIIELINGSFSQTDIELDASLYPNPFFGVNPNTFLDSDQEFLTLVDGGEDGEEIPIQPLLVQAREVDVIFAIDATADENNFTTGSSLIATQSRAALFPSNYAFPQVPNTTDQFVAQQLNTHPTFFGCDDSSPIPLVIYLANGSPPSGQAPLTNTTTFQTQYPSDEVRGMLDQTFLIATQGRPANYGQVVDPDWPACLACAIVDRKRGNVERSGVCDSCFSRYCWRP